MRKIFQFFIMLFMACLLCFSCRTKHEVQTEYVYVERNDSLHHLSSRIDSLLRESVKRDSIHEKDSVAVIIKGDTVMIDRWHIVYKEKTNYDNHKEKEIFNDTVYQSHTEYIDRYIEKEVIQEVNKLHWWQKILIWTGGASIIYILLILSKKIEKKL